MLWDQTSCVLDAGKAVPVNLHHVLCEHLVQKLYRCLLASVSGLKRAIGTHFSTYELRLRKMAEWIAWNGIVFRMRDYLN